MGISISFVIQYNFTFAASILHSSDEITMPKLLNLSLRSTEFINIPKMIGPDRSGKLEHFLRQRRGYPIVRRGRGKSYESWNQCYAYYTRDPEQILEEWITTFDRSQYIVDFTPSALADVLHHVGITNCDLLHHIRSYSGPLTMSTICHFPVIKKITARVPHEIGAKYYEFGTHLLQDETGAHMRSLEIELNRNSELINQRILQEWLNGEGRPVSWATLVEVLNIIQMGELAKKIEDKYITSPT